MTTRPDEVSKDSNAELKEKQVTTNFKEYLKALGLDEIAGEDQKFALAIAKDAQLAYHAYYQKFGFTIFQPGQKPLADITGTNSIGNLRAIFEGILAADLQYGPLNALMRKRAEKVGRS